jgi:hypothetical protein
VKQSNNLASKAVEDQTILATLGEAELRQVLAALLKTAAAVYEKWLSNGASGQIAKPAEGGDRLLSLKEIAKRMDCSTQKVTRGWKAGEYPFVFKHDGRLAGSEDGLERWIRNRTKSRSA